MRIIAIFVAAFLLSGCFFIVKEDEKVKIYGSSKEIAQDTIDRLYGPESQMPEKKEEVKLPQENIQRMK